MSTVLVTGSSGFIGSRLVTLLAERHEVIQLSRAPAHQAPGNAIAGVFDSHDDLRKVRLASVDVLVHLAAETGGRDEEAAVRVNVLGTLRLLRALIDAGCRRFVLASSVAAVGCLDEDFVPLSLPIPDDHPSLARDAYGLSKSLMESVARYCQRRDPSCTFIVFRIGAVRGEPEFAQPPDGPPTRPFVDLARVHLDDVLEAFSRATTLPFEPRFELLNLVGPDSHCAEPVAQVLRTWLQPRAGVLDLTCFEAPGSEYAPVYSLDRLRDVLQFSPTRSNQFRDCAGAFGTTDGDGHILRGKQG